MLLFASDLHLGRSGDPAVERACEQALIDCLHAHEDVVEGLYLVGDVFDAYIEYKHLVPKGFVRLQALLAEWTDRGVPVTYLVGNHDPWHRDYFERELGVRLVYGDVLDTYGGQSIYLAHGDLQAPSSLLYQWMRPLLRHDLPTALYRALLPADTGYGLARWVGRWLQDEQISPDKIATLRAFARRTLRTTPADLVVTGHTHRPEVCSWQEGTYLNLGAWYRHRTFGRLCGRDAALLRWNGVRPVVIESSQAAPADSAPAKSREGPES